MMVPEFIQGVKFLTEEQAGKFLFACIAYSEGEEYEVSDPMVAMLFAVAKETMDRTIFTEEDRRNRLRENGKKGGRPRKEPQNNLEITNENQEKTKEKPTETKKNQENQLVFEEKENEKEQERTEDILSLFPNENLNSNISNPLSLSNQEKKEKEIDKEKEESLSDTVVSVSPEEDEEKFSFKDAIDIWNREVKSLPKVTKVTTSRKLKIKARLREMSDDGDPYETLTKCCKMVEESDYLSGRSGRWTGCSFNWLMENSDNWVKVTEGNYRNRDTIKTTQSRVDLDVNSRYDTSRYHFDE